ncbi:MAG: TetR/AcrR family transcriptional regulator [Lachnospiraceae bacterium]|nr:TetR/AcrR family transcriptional regulator [Lachnospiraceae bacterium]
MADNFVSRKYRIVSSAIDLISELGLSALTTHNLAEKENTSEALMYKYFSGIDEVLTEVVEYYSSFDDGIRNTVSSKDISYVEKIRMYFNDYASYYDNYYALSTLMLQYEELLHNVNTRDKISHCITQRRKFVEELFKNAIDNGEITDAFTPKELANNATGMLTTHILDRRITYHKKTFKQEFMENLDKWLNILKCSDREGEEV